MDDEKWLKRKYPESFDEVRKFLNDNELRDFKNSNRKIGRILESVTQEAVYKKGSLMQFSRSNPVNDYNHPFVYAIFKCKVGYTQSGYHSFNIAGKKFIEILK